MNGDNYTLVIEPGYGRNGLDFLLQSIGSPQYFLSKSPFQEALTEFSQSKTKKIIKDYFENECISKDDLDEINDAIDSFDFNEYDYYRKCSELEIDEPYSPRELTDRTLMQLAGFECFVEEYRKNKSLTISTSMTV